MKRLILFFIAFTEFLKATPTVESKFNIPFSFERDQRSSGPRFVARGHGYFVSLESGKATIGASQTAISMTFSGARAVAPTAGPELPGKVNRIQGKNPADWKLGLAAYGEVRYQGIYQGVDAVYYGHNGELEFDLALAPGADASKIRLKFDGARNIKIDENGALILKTASGDFKLPLPRIYQTEREKKIAVAGHYRLLSRNEVAFELGSYDRKKALVIDPVISFVSILGGGSSQVLGMALDSSGNMYLAGRTYSSDFPTTAGVAQPSIFAGWDGLIAKLSPTGTLIWATYLGGSADDYLTSIAVDSTGAVWTSGYTYSSNFPVLNPYQATFGGGSGYDAILAKLSPSGALEFGTFLGSAGSSGYALAVDASNNVYFAGSAYASVFSTTSGALYPASSGGTSQHGFLMKFDSSGVNRYSTMLGGTGTAQDGAYGVAVDSSGNAYVTGTTGSPTFVGDPGGGAQTAPGNGFIAKVNPTGSGLVYFTFVGGACMAIRIDTSSPPNAYVAGNSYAVVQTTPGVVQPNSQGGVDAFVAKLNGTGTAFTYATYLGGARSDGATSLAVEPSTGDVYVGGFTQSLNFPVASPVQTRPADSNSLFQTANLGASWSAVDNALPAAAAAISPDPVTSGTWVVATTGGFYKTTNSGSSWTSSYAGSNIPSVSRSPVNSSILYGAANGSALVSTDGGNTWTLKGNLNGGAFVVADPLIASTVYAFGYYTSVLRSTDSGATWTALPIGSYSTQVSSLVASPSGALYAAVSSAGVYKSVDRGTTWTAQNSGLPPASFFPSTPNAISNPIGVTNIGGADILYIATNAGVYKSTNGAVTWSAVSGAVVYPSSVAVSPLNSNEVYAISGTYPTCYISTDGGTTWNAAAQNLGFTPPSTIVFDPTNTNGALAVSQPYSYSQGFVAKLNAGATSLIYSTYITADYGLAINGVATNGSGLVYAAGETSTLLPLASVNPTAPSPGSFGSGSVIAISDSTPACSVTLTPAQTLADSISFSQVVEFGVNAASGCTWTASSNQGWAQVISPVSGTGAGLIRVLVLQNSTGAVRTATIAVNSSTAILEQTFTACAYTINPANLTMGNAGGSAQVTITALTGCPWSVSNNDPGLLTVNSGNSGTGNGTVAFTVAPNYGLNSRSVGFLVGSSNLSVRQSGSCVFTLGAANVTMIASGGQGTVSVTASSNQCVWNAFSTSSLVNTNTGNPVVGSGTATYYLSANPGGPRTATLTIAGTTFTINQLSAGPQPAQVNPGSGTGSAQTFSFNFSDPNGYGDFSVLDVLINNYLDGQSACYFAYVPTSATDGYLYLVNDGGSGYAGPAILLSSGGVLQNSQCSVNTAASSVSASGYNLTLNLSINFKAAFAGNRIFFTAARSSTQNSGWQALGTWTVPGLAVTGPGVGGASPGRSSTVHYGVSTFTFTFTDTKGWQDLTVLDVLTNSYIDGAQACYFAYVPVSATDGYVYLVNDAGGGNYVNGSPRLLSTGQSLSNDQCTLGFVGSSASASGNTLTLTMNIQFLTNLDGNQIFYMAARNNGSGNSGWQAGGTVTVQ